MRARLHLQPAEVFYFIVLPALPELPKFYLLAFFDDRSRKRVYLEIALDWLVDPELAGLHFEKWLAGQLDVERPIYGRLDAAIGAV